MNKLVTSLIFLVFGSLAYGEVITIKNDSNQPVKIVFSNGIDSPKKFTLANKKTFKFNQGGEVGNGTFHVTGPFGLNHGPWNPRRTSHKGIRLQWVGGFPKGTWKVTPYIY